MRKVACVALCLFIGGCVTTEKVTFLPKGQQEAITRDGNPALVSKRNNSIVIIRPATREFAAGGRPVFVVGITNLTKAPMNFSVGNVHASQTINQQSVPMKVVTYEDLVAEERNRQVAAAILTGLAAGANAAAASQAGYYHSSSTLYGPRGTYQIQTTGYSPTAAAIAQSNAAAQNSAMINATVAQGQANLSALEHQVIKDNTLLPGEWYGGALHLQPPSSEQDGPKDYTIEITVGSDVHEIHIQQGPARTS